MASLNSLPPEMIGRIFAHLSPFEAPALKATCHRNNDAFAELHPTIRAVWVDKHLNTQITPATLNPNQLERQAISASFLEDLPDLILSMIERSNDAFLNDAPITVKKSELLALEKALNHFRASSRLADIHRGRMYSMKVYVPVTKALVAIEKIVERNLGPNALWVDVRAIRENAIAGGLRWVYLMLKGKETIETHRGTYEVFG